ncbi:epimerase family protein SDR39U1 [Culicoides brevitarsis]|uniref:epimerase family protein SDR39U1 n=1 Tax=Culicoides brevitarsis TaxID=469753 RepID=UPI00307BA65D
MSLKNVLIGGGSGFLGTRLTNLLKTVGYDVSIISRMPGANRITWIDIEKNGLPKDTSAVVNLAGQNVLDPTKRWSPGFKQNVWSSRINTTTMLAKAVAEAEQKPEVFVNIVGVSHYKPRADPKPYDESHPGENYDFMSKLCVEWEKAAQLPEGSKTRLVQVRTGAVVGREGGMIKSMFVPFFLGVGGPLASGKQFLPWIHVEDHASLVRFAIENQAVSGILNGVAPEIVTNAEFSKTLASSFTPPRPAIFPMPEFVVNLIFNEERAVIVTNGAKIEPKRTQELGFTYKYPDIKSACKEVAKLF